MTRLLIKIVVRPDIHQLYHLATKVTVLDEDLQDLQQDDLLAVRLFQGASAYDHKGLVKILETWQEQGDRRAQVLSRAALAAADMGSVNARFSWSREQLTKPETYEELFATFDVLHAAGADLSMAHANAGSFMGTVAGSRSALMMAYALERGCNPNQPCEDGRLPIDNCLVNRLSGQNPATLRLLIRGGADLSCLDKRTDTVEPMWTYDPEIAFTVLAYGGKIQSCSINANKYAGVTPLQAAARSKDQERILEIMQQNPIIGPELNDLRSYLSKTMEPDDPKGCAEVRATIEACASHQLLRRIADSASRMSP